MLNNDYVTPPLVVAQLSPYFGPEYFTDGDDRPAYKGAFQPRLGFSYDLTGKAETVVFGGWGRYYDRVVYNAILDEQFRLQYTSLTFRFSADGQPRDGQPDDRLGPDLSDAGGPPGHHRQRHRAQARGLPDRQRHGAALSDQFSAGIRQQFGLVGVSLAYARRPRLQRLHVDLRQPQPGRDLLHAALAGLRQRPPLRRDEAGLVRRAPAPGRQAVHRRLAAGARRSRTPTATRTANGGDLFSLDYLDVGDLAAAPRRQQDERHRS